MVSLDLTYVLLPGSEVGLALAEQGVSGVRADLASGKASAFGNWVVPGRTAAAG